MERRNEKPLKWHEEKDIITIERFMSKQDCRDAINFFESEHSKGRSYRRHEAPPDQKNDTAIGVNFWADWWEHNEPKLRFAKNVSNNFYNKVIPIMHDCYSTFRQYNNNENGLVTLNGFKIQKTVPGQGYHVWHTEDSGPTPDNRLFVFSVYLNDDFEGGETEFLHKQMRVTPKTGTAVIFPAGYTHDHRGNPPLTGEKYFLTTWATQNWIGRSWNTQPGKAESLGIPMPERRPERR